MTPPTHFRPASALLSELGITEPDEIDIEAIAQYCGATVIERPLSGCEARIIGVRDRAIITVNANSIRTRRRFSAAHELGHWMHDAGRVAFGCNPDSALGSDDQNPETRANRYASELLMPRFMFAPRAKGRSMTFNTVSELAALFATSVTATALRLVALGSFPSILVCTDRDGSRWVALGADVPGSFWPERPGARTFAARLLSGDPEDASAGDVSSDQWFASRRRHYLHEDSMRIGPAQVLSLLSWPDEAPLIEIQDDEERRAYRRSDRRDE
jgi:Zn-dependent peptidase ImmA (M78 family)